MHPVLWAHHMITDGINYLTFQRMYCYDYVMTQTWAPIYISHTHTSITIWFNVSCACLIITYGYINVEYSDTCWCVVWINNAYSFDFQPLCCLVLDTTLLLMCYSWLTSVLYVVYEFTVHVILNRFSIRISSTDSAVFLHTQKNIYAKLIVPCFGKHKITERSVLKAK